MRVRVPRPPTSPLVSAILLWTAACTRPNPAYVGFEDAGLSDAGSVPDAAVEPDGPSDGPSADAAADVAAPDAAPDSAPDAAPPSAGLVAHWALDEGQGTVVRDGTGNLNDGTLINGPVWIAGAVAGSALRFDGSDDYVELAVRTLPRAEAPKSLAVWFRNNATTPRLRNLVALFNDPMNTGIHLGFDTEQVAVWRYGDFDPIIKSTSAPDGGWHHLLYTWDGTTHHLYLDGASVGTSTAAMKNGAIQTARLGTWQVPEELFTGDLDDVRVYDRALTASEIAALTGAIP